MIALRTVGICCLLLGCAIGYAAGETNIDSNIESKTTLPLKLVQAADLRAIAQKNFPDFAWHRAETMAWWGRRATLLQPVNDLRAHLTVGVHASSEEAQSAARDYLDSVSMRLPAADASREGFGQSGGCWLYESEGSSSVVFVQRNVLVCLAVLGRSAKEHAKRVAKAVNQDIVEGTGGFAFGAAPASPIMRRVSMPTFLRVGEEKRIEVDLGTGPTEEPSLAAFSDGINHLALAKPEKSGTIVIQGRKQGRHKIVVVAVSANCLVQVWRAEVTVQE